MIRIEENGLEVVIDISSEGDVRLLHFSALPFDEDSINPGLFTKLLIWGWYGPVPSCKEGVGQAHTNRTGSSPDG